MRATLGTSVTVFLVTWRSWVQILEKSFSVCGGGGRIVYLYPPQTPLVETFVHCKFMCNIIWSLCICQFHVVITTLHVRFNKLCFFKLGYNPHCILSISFTTNGRWRSRRGCYLLYVETERDAEARHTSSRLVFHFFPFQGFV